MQMVFEISVASQRTIDKLSSMGTAVVRAISEGLETGVKLAASNVVRNYLSGQALKARTGALRRAVDGWLASEHDGVVGVRENSAVSKYAWLLTDEERTIVPKRSKFLAIPIGENLTGAGVPKFSSPRQVPDGFFINTGSKLLFGYRKGKTSRAKFRPLFVLVKSVLVQGSGALYDGVEESVDDIGKAIEDRVNMEIDRG